MNEILWQINVCKCELVWKCTIKSIQFPLEQPKQTRSFGYQHSTETIMHKIAWKDKNETKRDKSKTTRFLRILVRIFLIPLKIDPIKNEISFRFWSKPTMGHIILYWIPFFAIEVYTFWLRQELKKC